MSPVRILLGSLLLVLSLTAAPVSAAAAQPGAGGVVTRAVSFQVVNRNGTTVPCSADGQTYVLAGTLVAPAGARLDAPGPVTVYLHDLALGGFSFSFPDRQVDHAAQMAKKGQVSVVVDRLGYDASPRPDGTATCLGAHADMAAQLVAQLRAGSYTATGRSPVPVFDRVVLAGHSVGGAVAELATASFPGVDGLVEISWADTGPSQRAVEESAISTAVCLGGGEPSEEGGAPGYAWFGQTPEDFREVFFADADPSVVETATRLRNRDPCGDLLSLAPIVAVNTAQAPTVDVPVLLLFGERDALNRPEAGAQQQALLAGSPDVELVTVPGAGNALMLERSAPTTRETLVRWLCDHGFGRSCPAAQSPTAGPPPAAAPPGSRAAPPARLAATGGEATAAAGAAALLAAVAAARRHGEGNARRGGPGR